MGPGFESLKVHQKLGWLFSIFQTESNRLLISPAANVALGPGFESLKVHHYLNGFFLFSNRVKLTLNFACGECGIGSRVRISEGEVLLAKLAISAVRRNTCTQKLGWLFSIQKIRERQIKQSYGRFPDYLFCKKYARNDKSAHDN